MLKEKEKVFPKRFYFVAPCAHASEVSLYITVKLSIRRSTIKWPYVFEFLTTILVVIKQSSLNRIAYFKWLQLLY